ncbi:MAG: hypothetical protein ACYDC6_04795 [Acidobacteriaceae bacterium]
MQRYCWQIRRYAYWNVPAVMAITLHEIPKCDRLGEMETVAAIRVGLQGAKEGRVQPARKALKDLGLKAKAR